MIPNSDVPRIVKNLFYCHGRTMSEKSAVICTMEKQTFSSEKSGLTETDIAARPDLVTFNFFQTKKCYVGNSLRVFFCVLIERCVKINASRCVNLTNIGVLN